MGTTAAGLGGGRGNTLGGMFGFGGGGAAGDASKAMQAAQKKAGQEYKAGFGDIQGYFAPYTGLGSQSAGLLQSGTAGYDSPLLRSFGASDFQQDPGYQFRLQQGLNALQGSAAAKGGLLSGATMKGINQYGQDFASNEYQRAYDRYNQDQQNKYERLFGMTGLGANSANALSGYKMNTTKGIADSLLGIGEARASGFLGQQAQKQQGFENLMKVASMATGGMGGMGGGAPRA